MQFVRYFVLLLPLLTQMQASSENTVCKKCHPVIYAEYQSSMHQKASIFNDPVHKAVWDRHPDRQKKNYKCAKCHTPADHTLLAKKGLPQNNDIQNNEPISCRTCHTIEHIQEHSTSNSNVYSKKKKYFYSADQAKKGEKIKFKEHSSFLGLIKRPSGSPYHTIDYSNENFYNGNVCMGCHSHKRNGKGFMVCDLEVKQGHSKETCISCHMPKVKGSLANQKESATHAYHGINLHRLNPEILSKYIKLSIQPNAEGFTLALKNEATHTLFPQPLRQAQVRIEIERDGKTIDVPVRTFSRSIGTQGKPAMPWLADTVLKDTTIKAHETRLLSYAIPLKKGDTVLVEFGYTMVNPKAAKKLGITDPDATRFTVLTKAHFPI